MCRPIARTPLSSQPAGGRGLVVGEGNDLPAGREHRGVGRGRVRRRRSPRRALARIRLFGQCPDGEQRLLRVGADDDHRHVREVRAVAVAEPGPRGTGSGWQPACRAAAGTARFAAYDTCSRNHRENGGTRRRRPSPARPPPGRQPTPGSRSSGPGAQRLRVEQAAGRGAGPAPRVPVVRLARSHRAARTGCAQPRASSAPAWRSATITLPPGAVSSRSVASRVAGSAVAASSTNGNTITSNGPAAAAESSTAPNSVSRSPTRVTFGRRFSVIATPSTCQISTWRPSRTSACASATFGPTSSTRFGLRPIGDGRVETSDQRTRVGEIVKDGVGDGGASSRGRGHDRVVALMRTAGDGNGGPRRSMRACPRRARRGPLRLD